MNGKLQQTGSTFQFAPPTPGDALWDALKACSPVTFHIVNAHVEALAAYFVETGSIKLYKTAREQAEQVWFSVMKLRDQMRESEQR